MKYAIDRIDIGKEKEVRASDLNNEAWIPQATSRFYCPECGEPVHFVKRGRVQTEHFSHYKKTDDTPDCDNRVDGISELMLYERVGLPVYLTCNNFTNFKLNIGFPAVSEEILLKAQKLNTKVSIVVDNLSRDEYVNRIKFLTDSTTLIPVNFVPVSGNYKIEIQNADSLIWGLKRKWSDYADGFGNNGAIFTFGENGGKKIRKNDFITPNREYFVVSKKLITQKSLFESEQIGTINLNSERYNVYKIIITVSSDDNKAFEAASYFFKNNFGVWLLNTPRELIPLWPPVVSRDEFIPVIENSTLYYAVSSDNDMPRVYSYSGYQVRELKTKKSGTGSCIIKIPCDINNVILSVDRKYAGREICIKRKPISLKSYNYKFSIENYKKEIIPLKKIERNDLKKEFFINCNSRLDLYIENSGLYYDKINIREENKQVISQINPCKLIFVIDDYIVYTYELISNTGHSLIAQINEKKAVNSLQSKSTGNFVPVPNWINLIITKCRKNNLSILYNFIVSSTNNGKMRIGLLKELSKFK